MSMRGRGLAGAVLAAVLAAGCALIPGQQPAEPAASPEPTAVDLPTVVPLPTPAAPTAHPSPSPSPAQPADWDTVVDRVRGGVVRLEMVYCDGSRSMGSGFAVGGGLIMTAAHVVQSASSVTLRADRLVSTAEVLKVDRRADIALIRAADTFPTRLVLRDSKPRLASSIAVLGFPDWVLDLRVTQGLVSGLDASVDYGDVKIDHLIATDAAINGGNSGGPVIDRGGRVVGLVTGKSIRLSDNDTPAEGLAYVVPSPQLVTRLRAWAAGRPLASPCGGDVDPPVENAELRVRLRSNHPDAQRIAQTLALHGQSINVGDYEAAWAIFTARQKRRLAPFANWQQGLGSSYWKRLVVDDVRRQGPTARVAARLRTEQSAADGPRGQTCSDWSMTYTLQLEDAAWQIDRVTPTRAPRAC